MIFCLFYYLLLTSQKGSETSYFENGQSETYESETSRPKCPFTDGMMWELYLHIASHCRFVANVFVLFDWCFRIGV